MKKLLIILLFLVLLVVIPIGLLQLFPKKAITISFPSLTSIISTPTPTPVLDPLSIATMRSKSYPGSTITIEKTLPNGSNYHQYLTSYVSDGLKIYALLTVPFGEKPNGGWPVILFNHGYIAPETYQTTPSVGQYASYTPFFSSNGYIVFKPDYRGNGNSQGTPEGAYYSPAYAIDDLNALASIKKYPDANPNKIGAWGHSMGGNITLRDLVVNTKDIKVAVIWGGVVGSYYDLMNNWQRKVRYVPSPRELALRNASRTNLITKYGSPSANPTFWNSVDPTFFLKDITAPIQLDVGAEDEEVPVAFSQSLYDKLKALGKVTELYIYPGDNHNISGHLYEAMQHSLEFFNKYLK